MTPDGNSDAEEERANTGTGKYLYKCEKLYLFIYFFFYYLNFFKRYMNLESKHHILYHEVYNIHIWQ